MMLLRLVVKTQDPLSHVKNYFNMVDVTDVVDSMQLPLNNPQEVEERPDDEAIHPPPF